MVLIVAIGGWYLVTRRGFFSPIGAATLVLLVSYRFPHNPPDLLCCALIPFLLLALERSSALDLSSRQKLRYSIHAGGNGKSAGSL